MKKWILVLILILFLQGCRSPLLESAIAIRETILPEYIELVRESSKYSEREKKYRVRNAEAFIELIDTAEKGGEEE